MSGCESGKCDVGVNQNRDLWILLCSQECGWGVTPAPPVNQETLEDEHYHNKCPRCGSRLFLAPVKNYLYDDIHDVWIDITESLKMKWVKIR